MSWIISYLVALLLLVFDLICIHSKNRIGAIGRILIFFIPLVNIAFEIGWILGKFFVVFYYRDGILNDNRITRWLFNGADESVFYHN